MAGYDWEGAERPLELFLAEFPRESSGRRDLCKALQARDRYDKAIEVIQEGLRLDPNDHTLWNQLAFSHIGIGSLTAALEANERCSALLPGDPYPSCSRGDLLFIAGRDWRKHGDNWTLRESCTVQRWCSGLKQTVRKTPPGLSSHWLASRRFWETALPNLRLPARRSWAAPNTK
jgi:tetratricopeptide (TPR) repeat protein